MLAAGWCARAEAVSGAQVIELRQQQQPTSADAYHASHPTGVLQEWLEAVLGLYDDQGKPQVARVPDHVMQTCEALGQVLTAGCRP